MKIIFSLSIITLLLVSCSNPDKDFIGRYNFQIPSATLYKDTSEVFYNFGMKSHPSISYYDLYPGEVEIFENGDMLKGLIKFQYPENASLFNSNTKIKEQTLEMNNIHFVNDTLIFTILANTFGSQLSGIAYKEENTVILGISKDLFHIKASECVESLPVRLVSDKFFFRSGVDKSKEFYECQINSQKELLAKANTESEIKNIDRTIKLLESKSK